MDRLGLTRRLLLVLVAGALPPLVTLAVAVRSGGPDGFGMGQGTLFAVLAVLTVGWCGLIAAIGSRGIGRDIGSLISLAERRTRADTNGTDASGMGSAFRRLANLLKERDRQLRVLAEEVASAPITSDGQAVAHHVAATARRVTGDETWILAVLTEVQDLVRGSYDGTGEIRQLSDLHRWAATLEPAEDGEAQLSEGPWGAFLVVRVSGAEPVQAVLMAPWEGRPPPSAAEQSLLALLAQHAATALDHALLYGRVRSQAEELNRLAAVQSDFLRGVTHDLQSPLTSISTVASGLRAQADMPQAALSDLDAITHQANRMRRMVSQLLTMSAMDVGAIQPRSEVFRVEPIIRRIWSSMRQPDSRLELVSEGPDRLVVADPDRLEQALWSVIDNALKYSPDGSPILVRRRVDAAGERVAETIAVTDSGIGMDAETRRRAVEQFYRSDEARRISPDGSGVGLYTASGLVRLMGGELTLESALGSGTTVLITLPAEVTGADEPAAGALAV